MVAERIYRVRGIVGHVVLCDDGEYHRTTPSMRILSGVLAHDYVPRRIGRGAEDITDSSEGRALLATANAERGPMSTAERAKTAATARWGDRGESARIRVDRDVAEALELIPETDRRRFASDAIRAAIAKSRTA